MARIKFDAQPNASQIASILGVDATSFSLTQQADRTWLLIIPDSIPVVANLDTLITTIESATGAGSDILPPQE